MMCGRDEELWPSVIVHWKSLWLAKLWTHGIDREKWVLRGLKKTADNAR
jgi:hypothetical protein